MRIPVLLIAGLIALGPAAHAAEAPSANGASPAAAPAPAPSPPGRTTPLPGQARRRRGATGSGAGRRSRRLRRRHPRGAPGSPHRFPRRAPRRSPAIPRARGGSGSRRLAPSMAPVAQSPTYLSMDFTDVELPVLIKFMSEQTKKNFIFDERVQGKITIISPRRVTLDEAYDVFLYVLQAKGFTTVTQGNTIKIVAAREARQDTIHTGGLEGYRLRRSSSPASFRCSTSRAPRSCRW